MHYYSIFMKQVIIIGICDHAYGRIRRREIYKKNDETDAKGATTEKEQQNSTTQHHGGQGQAVITFPFAMGRSLISKMKGKWERYFSRIIYKY